MQCIGLFLFLFLLQAIIHTDHNLAFAQHQHGPIQQVHRCKDDSGFLSDSQQKHRDTALDALSVNITVPEYTGHRRTQSKGFKPDDLVNGVMLCPPNIKPEACVECIKKTVPFLKQNCPKQREAVGWSLLSNLNSCMVRYAGYEIYRKYTNWTQVSMWNPDYSRAKGKLTRSYVYETAYKLMDQASDGGARRKFASGKMGYDSEPLTVYMSVQCTPDLLKPDCNTCLFSGIMVMFYELEKRQRWSGRILYPNCYVRFAHDNFLPN